ncbi:hypothetical protein DY218_01625 [Streptomyces triticagri]|uniref:Uncharacterized protein n=1 Tax=Streptomyces triticagri TaxID=2293568 RepID=A0A372MBX9_9ACTN|nr:hypothetical protein [Streptomyces triticagri]RFU88464.1 hypothetical protein DY218_01625 [Streptomyces triticagri]
MNAAAPTLDPLLSVQARDEYNALTEAQRGIVDQAIGMLARDPEARGTVDEGQGARRAFVSQDLQIRYGVHRNILVIAEIIVTGGGFLLGGGA